MTATGRRRAIRAALAVFGGVAWGLCFQRLAMPWLACFALAPLFLLLGSRRAVLWGWLFGIVTWLVAMPWIVHTLHVFGAIPRPLSVVLLVLMSAYLGADQALFAWLGSRLWRRHTGWSLLALPALWVAIESLRGLFFSGFPWNLAAYAWTDLPGALELSSWIGAYGISALLAAANLAVALIARRVVDTAAPQRALWLPASLVGAVVVALLLGATLAGPRDAPTTVPTDGPTFAVIQPNALIATDERTIRANYRKIFDMSRRECAAGAELLIWPESAAWPFSYANSVELRTDLAQLNASGCDVVLSSVIRRQGETYNASILVDEDGVQGEYAKRHLVPWGEYVPLADLLPFVGKLARNAGDFTPGTSASLLPWRDQQLAMAICYEVVFPVPVAEQVQAGATTLLTITNDAWYGDSAAPWQHLRAAQFRAAENHRPLLRAALTGVSAVIGRDGRLRSSLDVGEQGALRGQLSGGGLAATDDQPTASRTIYSRWPMAPLFACWLVAAFAIISTLRATPKHRS